MASQKQKQNFTAKLVGVVFLAGAIFFLSRIGFNALDTANLQKAHDEKMVELENVEKENSRLEHTKAKLSDENYVQTYARGKYMFSSEDDSVFYLPGASDSD